MRRRVGFLGLLGLVCALGLPTGFAVPAGTPAAAADEPRLRLEGTLDASDGRAVNALLGFDFLDAHGRRLRRDGCVQSPECPLVGYAQVVLFNSSLPPEGSVDRDAHTTTWAVDLPPGTAQVFLEAYPRNPRHITDETRYGHAMRHSVRVPSEGPVVIHLPLVLCGEGGTVGSIEGGGVRAGRPEPLRRVVAWSLDPYDAVTRPVVGWNIGTASDDGSFRVPNLASGQRYQVWLTAADGTVRKTFGVPVEPCAPTPLTVSFDPPAADTGTATISPSPSPEPAPEPPSAPTVRTPVITAGQAADLTGAAAPGQQVELWAYSRPSTEFRLVRTTTALPSGLYTFSVLPPTSTRLRVRVAGQDSDSVVVAVRPRVSLAARRTGVRRHVLSGGTGPARAGVVVSVTGRPPSGGPERVLVTTRTDGAGRWRVERTFLADVLLDVVARTRGDLTSAPGVSRALRLRTG